MKNTKEAFLWITDILEKNNIQFKISGGFAAKIYGCTRELADIDIDIPEKYIDLVAKEVSKYITYGPDQYKDDNWDLKLLTLQYEGQEIDIASAEAKIFNAESNKWEDSVSDLNRNTIMEVYGKKVPVETIDKLIEYKTKLARDVDIEDVRQLTEIKKNNFTEKFKEAKSRGYNIGSCVRVECEGKFLLLTRSKSDFNAGIFELPGGSVDEGESLEKAAVRELFEESGIVASENDVVPLTIFEFHNIETNKHKVKFAFSLNLTSLPEIILSADHSGFVWLSRDEINKLPLQGRDTDYVLWKDHFDILMMAD